MATTYRKPRIVLYGGPLDGLTVNAGDSSDYTAPIELLQSLSDGDNNFAILHPVRYAFHPVSGRYEFQSSGAPTKPNKRK